VQDFYITLNVKRMPLYFMVNSVCPSYLLNLFTLFAYALPPGKFFLNCWLKFIFKIKDNLSFFSKDLNIQLVSLFVNFLILLHYFSIKWCFFFYKKPCQYFWHSRFIHFEWLEVVFFVYFLANQISFRFSLIKLTNRLIIKVYRWQTATCLR
jgi:hypothetical protein